MTVSNKVERSEPGYQREDIVTRVGPTVRRTMSFIREGIGFLFSRDGSKTTLEQLGKEWLEKINEARREAENVGNKKDWWGNTKPGR